MHLPQPRTVYLTAILTAALLTAPAIARAQTKPSGLPPAIREQMDAASARFTSAQADLKQELFTKVVHDTETQTGQIYFLRKAGSTQMGMTLLPPDAAPGAQPAQVLEFKDGKGRMFNPGTNQIDESSATGKNQALAETFLTLGFGGSGTDLAKSWTIDDQGSEPISDGKQTVKTEKLDLVSKDPGIRNSFSHITVWIDPARDVSLKQVSYQASGDTRTMYYTNIRLNQPVDIAPFAIKCKGKCTVVTH
ncbi:MAG: outer membrane lipoprotein-sorting protein [Acidobacteriaceae bacterium]|jgi:outer membrane lipoprotein-sorting protein